MYQHHPEQTFTPFAEVLGVLGEAVKAGKIRHVGLSNETAWGDDALAGSRPSRAPGRAWSRSRTAITC